MSKETVHSMEPQAELCVDVADLALRLKVEAARACMRAGLGHSNEEVEATFAARREQVAADQRNKASER
ncbi:hypothetical protein JC796_08535 [Delftia acidovorans]|uniref:hypothetical protein n=1 Tax=Delftia acidovorans TaxID=80866 RepID=UPI0018E8F8AD|nr:hypothetical protein [Delftia acidovorans]MBJ2140774.1 hypothetical protein [Delftia acidovorans]